MVLFTCELYILLECISQNKKFSRKLKNCKIMQKYTYNWHGTSLVHQGCPSSHVSGEGLDPSVSFPAVSDTAQCVSVP